MSTGLLHIRLFTHSSAAAFSLISCSFADVDRTCCCMRVHSSDSWALSLCNLCVPEKTLSVA